MTSKEALEVLLGYASYNENYYINKGEDPYKVIKQDLDRLEKYKKAIELLKKYIGFKLVIDPVDSVRGITTKYEYSDISKEEYEVLDEVLK